MTLSLLLLTGIQFGDLRQKNWFVQEMNAADPGVFSSLFVFLLSSFAMTKMIDEIFASKMKRAVHRRVRPEKKDQKDFGLSFKVYPSRGHSHAIVRRDGKLVLTGTHEHNLSMNKTDLEALSAVGQISLNTSFTDSWDHSYHSHKVIVTA